MVFVPTGEPLYDKLSAKDFHPPTLLGMLSASHLNGYARFSFPAATGFFLFQAGRLAEAVFDDGGERARGTAAITACFGHLAAEDGVLDVYKLSSDLTASVHALLLGKMVFEGQALGLVNVKSVLERFRDQSFTGCLRIYTDERTALIFYKGGKPLGFFHDGSTEIETSPAESQNIARLPGAKLDAYATPALEEVMVIDHLAQIDTKELWAEAQVRQKEREAVLAKRRAEQSRQRRVEAAAALEAELKTLVTTHLGPPGRPMFDKVLAERIGRSALAGSERLEADLDELGKAARLLTGASKTRQLLADVRQRIESWLAHQALSAEELR